MSNIYEDETPAQRIHMPAIHLSSEEYKTPPGITVHLEPGDNENGLDIEIIVRSNVETNEQMLNRARRALTEALKPEDEDG